MMIASAPAPVDKSQATSSFERYRNYLIFLFGTCVYLLPFMRILVRGTDEGTFDYGAVRIVHGQVFARDFFEVMGPGTFYWLAAFFKIFGISFFASRISLFLLSAGTALVMYFLSRRVCSRYKLLPCLILAGAYFGGLWPAVSHHVDSNFFALLSVACMVLWIDRGSNKYLFAAGAVAAATTTFLQPKGVFLFCAFAAWLLIQHIRKAAPLSSFGYLVGGYASVIGVVAIYFWQHGALASLIDDNFLWPSKHYEAVNSVYYGQGILLNYWSHFVVVKEGFRWTIGMGILLMIPILLVAGLPVLLPAVSAPFLRRRMKPEILLYALSGAAMWLSEIHRKEMAHIIFGSPLLIILFVYFVGEYRGRVARIALQLFAITSALLVAFNLCLTFTAHAEETRVGPIAMFKPSPALTFLNEHIAPGEEIFAYPYCPRFYFWSGATNPTRYSLLIYNYNTPDQFREVVRVLEERKVKYVLWDASFRSKTAVTFFPSAADAPVGGLIMEPYLESHYTLVTTEEGIRILVRKDDGPN